MINIVEIKDKGGIKKFINLAFELYKSDDNWVAPLKYDLAKTLTGRNNPLFISGPHALYMAFEGDKPLGRICVGINETINEKRGQRDGYISLFECIQDYSVAERLFDTAKDWLKERGINCIKGPVSPTNGDDSKGLLVEGFDGPPVLMNSYNPEFYRDYFERYGFIKHEDLYAYYCDTEITALDQYKKAVDYAMKRYNFTVESINMKDLEGEARALKTVMDAAMPEWEDLTPPSLEDIRAEMNQLKSMADPDLILIARSYGEPIGFIISLPDYNQVLKKMKGNLFPFGFIKFLKYRKKINGIRLFVLFVVPEFRKKAVSSAMLYKTFENAVAKGYEKGEGSTIGESNINMRRDVEKAGGRLYRTYRIYKKDI